MKGNLGFTDLLIRFRGIKENVFVISNIDNKENAVRRFEIEN